MWRPRNRLQLMERLGAVQLNTVWSWCGVNHEAKKVYFSIWTDKVHEHIGGKSYIIQEPDWGINEETANKSAARSDQDAKFALVFEHKYESYGYFIVAKNPTAYPREIEKTCTSFVVRLQLETLLDGSIVGIPRDRIEIS